MTIIILIDIISAIIASCSCYAYFQNKFPTVRVRLPDSIAALFFGIWQMWYPLYFLFYTMYSINYLIIYFIFYGIINISLFEKFKYGLKLPFTR